VPCPPAPAPCRGRARPPSLTLLPARTSCSLRTNAYFAYIPQAPALIVYEWAVQWDEERARHGAHVPAHVSDGHLWTSALIYVCCAAYRLARFNVGALKPGPAEGSPATGHKGAGAHVHSFSAPHVDQGGSEREPTHAFATTYVSRAKFFRGVPAPQAALMAVTPVVLALRQAALLAPGGVPACAVRGAVSAAGASPSPIAQSIGIFLQGVTGTHARGGNAQQSHHLHHPSVHAGALAEVLAECESVPPAWPLASLISARALAATWLCVLGALMVSTSPMLSSKMLMRDPATESHLRNRSPRTLALKVTAAAIFVQLCLSVKSWSYWALSACLAVEAVLLLTVPLGPLVYAHLAS